MEKILDEWLGWGVRDRVSGFLGTVATIGVDLYGCVQAVVDPAVTVDEHGSQKRGDPSWFDLTRLEKVGTNPVMKRVMPRYADSPGGYDKPTR